MEDLEKTKMERVGLIRQAIEKYSNKSAGPSEELLESKLE